MFFSTGVTPGRPKCQVPPRQFSDVYVAFDACQCDVCAVPSLKARNGVIRGESQERCTFGIFRCSQVTHVFPKVQIYMAKRCKKYESRHFVSRLTGQHLSHLSHLSPRRKQRVFSCFLNKTYWCLAGNFREWSTITINNHPSNPHSHPFPTFSTRKIKIS